MANNCGRNCFLCHEMTSSTSEQQENSVKLCKIFGLPDLAKQYIPTFEINYCTTCSDRILDTAKLLEELLKLEKEILEVKCLIESQLKGNSQYSQSKAYAEQNSSEQFRDQILEEIKYNSVYSMLWKIGKKQKQHFSKHGRIMRNVTISPTTLISVDDTEKVGQNFDPTSLSSETFSKIANKQNKCDLLLSPPLERLAEKSSITVDTITARPATSHLYDESIIFKVETDEDDLVSNTDSFERNERELEPEFDDKVENVIQNIPDDQLTKNEMDLKPIIIIGFTHYLSQPQTEETTFQVQVKDSEDPRFQSQTQPQILNEKWECKYCNKIFQFQYELRAHVKTHPNSERFKCKYCDKCFISDSAVESHERKHTGEKPYKCQYCDNTFAQQSGVNRHELTHTGEKPFACQSCEKSFAVRTALERHELTHTGEKPYKCQYCEKSYRQQADLKKHELLHKEGPTKDHLCKYCGQAFRVKSSLKDHERIHTGERTHKCNYCEKLFSHKPMLIEHERNHTGEKPFLCQYCEKSFTTNGALKKHERRHTEEKRFKCQYCEKKFLHNYDLRSHELIHTGEKHFKCPHCDRTFISSSQVNSHVRCIHKGEKPFKCQTCDKKFSCTTNLKVHKCPSKIATAN